VNKTLKNATTAVVSTAVASVVAKQIRNMHEMGPEVERAPLKVETGMNTLKPMVVKGMIDGITFFEAEEGRKLIKKGFEKAGIMRCFTNDFQKAATKWLMRTDPTLLSPTFTPAELLPPTAELHRGWMEPIAMVTEMDEELMDLIPDD
jgi:hypothetical protein